MPAISISVSIKASGAALGEIGVLYGPDTPNPLLELKQPLGLAGVLGLLLLFSPTREMILKLADADEVDVRWTLYQEDV